MSEEDRINLREKLNRGLEQSYEDMLKRKAMLGESVIVPDADGNPMAIPAREEYARYMAGK